MSYHPDTPVMGVSGVYDVFSFFFVILYVSLRETTSFAYLS
nr:MAG TPA: hypothetical protein [Bacteriophage sp.]